MIIVGLEGFPNENRMILKKEGIISPTIQLTMALFRCSNDTPDPSAFHVMTRRSLSLWFTSSNQEIGTINWPWADLVQEF